MNRWTLGHRPGLDGLRGVAILLVMVAHAAPSGRWGAGGSAGVTIFFTLSGFLITALLVGERERIGRVRFGAFYLRRARRLFPALAVMVIVCTMIGYVVDGFPATPKNALLGLSYVSNWVIIAKGDEPLGIFGHTWSLSIEEQFYVVWPLVLVLAMRSRHWRGIVYAITASAWIYAFFARWIYWYADGPQRVYSGADTRMDALLVGCSLAVWMTSRSVTAKPSPRTDALLVTIPILVFGTAHPAMDYLLNPGWIPLLVACVLYRVSAGNYSGLLTNGVLRYVGSRSYALYLWHGPIAGLIEMELGLSHWLEVGVAYALSFLLAEASWRLVERPFLRRGQTTPETRRRNSNEAIHRDSVPGSRV